MERIICLYFIFQHLHWVFFLTIFINIISVSQYEELETLYACVSKYAFEGLATYEKSAGASSAASGGGGGAGALLGPLMMLKACCTSSPSYIDRLISPLMRVLQRMARDHVAPNPDSATSDLLVSSHIRNKKTCWDSYCIKKLQRICLLAAIPRTIRWHRVLVPFISTRSLLCLYFRFVVSINVKKTYISIQSVSLHCIFISDSRSGSFEDARICDASGDQEDLHRNCASRTHWKNYWR